MNVFHFKAKYFLKFPGTTYGFTLVELMMVIAIIGLLASIVFSFLKQPQQKARDAHRMQELHEIYKAVELYALNNNGQYFIPSSPHCFDSDGTPHCARSYSCEDGGNWGVEFSNAMAPYIQLPQDPLVDCSGDPLYRKYVYMSDGKDFKLQFLHPEYPDSLKTRIDPALDGGPTNVGGQAPNPGSCTGPGDGTDVTAWSIYTPGAECWTH